MNPLHFNAKTMTEKRARIAVQEGVIAKAQAILDDAENEKRRDQIVDRIFALMSGVVVYKKTQRYVRVLLNFFKWEVTDFFIQSVGDKTKTVFFGFGPQYNIGPRPKLLKAASVRVVHESLCPCRSLQGREAFLGLPHAGRNRKFHDPPGHCDPQHVDSWIRRRRFV
jgi:hypothetical protein